MMLTSQMQIEFVHGDDLGITTAGSTTLDAKGRTLRWLADTCKRDLAKVCAERLSQTNSCGGLALTERRGGDTSNDNVLAVGAVRKAVQNRELHLGLVLAVELELGARDADLAAKLCNLLGHLLAGNLDVGGNLLFEVELQRRGLADEVLLEDAVSRGEDVLHQHGNRHGSDTAWDRGDVGGDLGGSIGVDVTNESGARLFGAVRDDIGAHVNDDSARLEPVALDKVRLANGGNENIGLTNELLQVLGGRVALGDGGILASEHSADGATDNVRASEDHSMLALEVESGVLEQNHGSCWGAWSKERLRGTRGEEANVVGVEAIDVLLGRDSFGDATLAFSSDVVREGQLNKHTMHSVVMVETLHGRKNLGFVGSIIEDDVGEFDLGLTSSLFLHAHISGRVGASSLLDNSQMGFEARVLGLQCSNLGADALTDGSEEKEDWSVMCSCLHV